MGLDIGQIFANAKEEVSRGMEDLLKMGGAAGLGYLEDQAIKIIEADKAKNEAVFKTNVAEILKRPSSADSLGSYVTNSLQSPLIKEYGPYILIGGCLIAVGVIFLGRR